MFTQLYLLDNFSDDFVYDDIVMRNSIAQKANKELAMSSMAGSSQVTVHKHKKPAKKQKSTLSNAAAMIPQILQQPLQQIPSTSKEIQEPAV